MAPGGVAILIETVTDNKNRTVGEVRSILTKKNGNMAESGAVSYMFKNKGLITIPKEGLAEDNLMEIVLDSGAEDLSTQESLFEITTEIRDLEKVKEALNKKDIQMQSFGLTRVPDTMIPVRGDSAQKLVLLIQSLEDNDDVTRVYTNADFDEKELEGILGWSC